MKFSGRLLLQFLIILITSENIKCIIEQGYLRYVKDGCFQRKEALSCLKYKALKLSIKSFFGGNHNETIKAGDVISIIPLDEETVKEISADNKEVDAVESKSFMSEWTELTKYIMKLVKNFFQVKGLKVDLPEGARTVEEEDDNGRGKKKKLALVVPLLTLLATLKTKFLLFPILLAVLFIKKLLIAAAFFLPSLLQTLKHCKYHHPAPHYSYVGSEFSDSSSDYGNSYYSSGGGYSSKDWAANRAYNPLKHRSQPPPMYITAPGPVNAS